MMNDKQSPKVCPVSGMFLEEPECKELFWIDVCGDVMKTYYSSGSKSDKAIFDMGNCFATSEDAERYAKHLKVMAKLRRLGGIRQVKRYRGNNDNPHEQITYIEQNEFNQLTPEEQNALKWPNEEK